MVWVYTFGGDCPSGSPIYTKHMVFACQQSNIYNQMLGHYLKLLHYEADFSTAINIKQQLQINTHSTHSNWKKLSKSTN